tara:strand:+ start:115 stop:309 length:195 start_codon:yes stop_codon:yes gene_type:complete
MQSGLQYKQNLSTERGLKGVSMDRERGNPNPNPNPLYGILGALVAKIAFFANVKRILRRSAGIS